MANPSDPYGPAGQQGAYSQQYQQPGPYQQVPPQHGYQQYPPQPGQQQNPYLPQYAHQGQPPQQQYASQQYASQQYAPQAAQQYPQANHQPQPAPYQQGFQQGGYPQQGGPVFEASFLKHTGMLIAWQHRTIQYHGSFEEIQAAYKAAQVHCATAGWWSIASILFWNWYCLIRNAVTFGKIKKAAGR
jgi:hypothetical protein